MQLSALVRPAVLTQPTYEPGKPIEAVARELGLDPAGILKLASNENPCGPSPRAVAAATRALAQGELYPDGGCYELRHRLAAVHGLAPDQFVVGNGSNEIIELLGHVFLGPGDEVVMGNPAFVVYKLVTLLFGARPVEVPLRDWRHDLPAMAAAITPRTKLVCVCSPNNPTGTANEAAELLAFVRALPPHVVAVIDEAYADYLENPPDLRPLLAEGRKVAMVGAPSERAQVAAAMPPGGVVNLCGELSLAEWLAAIATADAVVANDSAAVHAAAGLGRPLVGLYGATDPSVVGPYRRAESVEAAPGPAPSDPHAYRDDALQSRMNAISVEAVRRRLAVELDRGPRW